MLTVMSVALVVGCGGTEDGFPPAGDRDPVDGAAPAPPDDENDGRAGGDVSRRPVARNGGDGDDRADDGPGADEDVPDDVDVPIDVDPPIGVGEPVEAPEAPADPAAPALDDGTALPWTSAPVLSGVTVTRNRDSALIQLPSFAAAADFRAFVLHDDVTLELGANGSERVLGATLHCAGHEQHNAPDSGERVPVRAIEVTGVTGPVRIVVEALDTTCPFPGVIGREHADIEVTNAALSAADTVPFSVFSEDEVRARYGSHIVNGHRKGTALGAPASDEPARVLARTTVEASPLGGPTPVQDFFSGFDDDEDQPVLVGDLPPHGRAPFPGKLYENSDFTFTTYAQEHTQFFLDRGQLHVLLADWEQDVFGSTVAYPKRVAVMSDDAYVHVTFEVASNATARRYWWLSLCGAGSPGATLDEDGRLLGNIIQTPFFYQDDGKNPSLEKWSCLQLFPRDGLANPLPPSNTRPESDLRVMVNVPNAGERDSVRNVSPAQYPSALSARGWYRQMDADGTLTAPILDDQMLIAPKARYDVYVRDDRVIVYVNGEQRLCNDFPGTPLTMAEAAVGFGQALYHSAAERVEFSRSFNDRTGQRYYLENTPYVDARAWDNVGFDDEVAAPAGFDEDACYVHGG